MTELLNELRACGETLPTSLRERIVAEGASTVPGLLEMLTEDEESEGLDDDGSDWASIHAVDLLADLKAEAAVGPMLRVLAETDWDHVIHARIVVRMPDLGTAVLEPALAKLAESPSDDFADSLCTIIAELGIRDERIFQHLVARFPKNPELASGWLAAYGDARGIPLIQKEILDFVPDEDDDLGLHWLRDLVEAYERLAGPLSEELREHVEALEAEWTALRSPAHAPITSPPKIGRNDPCPCGSGKKYKRCHLGNDAF
ncbi:MAG TPA: SEC-C metal-binding domain-containing protein [Polyangiaceae bacterium]|nr:SEC-C metal-binding domain-containing protein [Polyangiaceae bacterium]